MDTRDKQINKSRWMETQEDTHANILHQLPETVQSLSLENVFAQLF